MLPIFISIATGIVIGYWLRNQAFVKYSGMLLSVIIMLLLFFLGVSVGANEQVISNFSVIGKDAFIITVGGTLGSVLCAWIVYVKFFNKQKKR